MQVYWPGVIAIFFMYGVIFLVGVWASRGRTTTTDEGTLDELMLAGRSLPLGIGLLSMTATWVGGGYINGTAETTYSYGLLWGLQAPIAYSLSLILGGLFFTKVMRENRYATLIDPLQIRFGNGIALVMTSCAVLCELIWSAAILVALGSTFATVVGFDFTTALVVSAAVAIGYTITGGLWSVAWTDAVQLVLIVIGLAVAVPFAWQAAGGTEAVWATAATKNGVLGVSGTHEAIAYTDYALLLLIGGIPWNVYFQRVLATPSAKVASRLSIAAGFLCMAMAVPALLLGLSARATDWAALPAAVGMPGGGEAVLATVTANASQVLPLQLRLAVPGWVGVLGLGAVAAAVMSSSDSSILSATSMASWNGYKRLINPKVTATQMVWIMRGLIIVIGCTATFIALTVQSVTALWYLCGDVAYVFVFPPLFLALFDKQANRIGVAAGIAISTAIRIGGGEASIGIPPILPFPIWTESPIGGFPFRTLAVVAGLLVAVLVSRATQTIDPPRPLTPNPESL